MSLAEDSISYTDFVLYVGTGLLGGALIGLERERAQLSEGSKKRATIPGFRSMGFVGLYGSLSSFLALALGGPGALALMLAFPAAAITLLVVLYAYARMVKGSAYGFTTYLVILVTFLIGVLAGMGLVLEAASISVAVSLLLAMKDPIVRLTKSMSYQELVAMLEVAALIVIVGPLVRTYSTLIPWIDVFSVYLFFTAVVGISFASYVAARLWGARGVVTGSFLASLVNSEAVIASLASRRGLSYRPAMMLTALIVSAMQLRSSALAALALALAGLGEVTLYSPFIALALFSIGVSRYASLTLQRGVDDVPSTPPKNPLDWAAALRGASVYLALIAVTKIMAPSLEGPSQVLAAGIIGLLGGVASATAALLTLATSIDVLGAQGAAVGMLASIFSATLNKVIYARVVGVEKDAIRGIAVASLLLSLAPLALAIITLVFVELE